MNDQVNWKDKGVDFAMNVFIGIGMALFSYWLSQNTPTAPQTMQATSPSTAFFTIASLQSSPLVEFAKWASGIGAALLLLKGFAALDVFDAHDAVSGIDGEDISDVFN